MAFAGVELCTGWHSASPSPSRCTNKIIQHTPSLAWPTLEPSGLSERVKLAASGRQRKEVSADETEHWEVRRVYEVIKANRGR